MNKLMLLIVITVVSLSASSYADDTKDLFPFRFRMSMNDILKIIDHEDIKEKGEKGLLLSKAYGITREQEIPQIQGFKNTQGVT